MMCLSSENLGDQQRHFLWHFLQGSGSRINASDETARIEAAFASQVEPALRRMDLPATSHHGPASKEHERDLAVMIAELTQNDSQGHSSSTTRGTFTAAATRRECVQYLITTFEYYQVSSETVCASIKVLDIFLLLACEIKESSAMGLGLGHAQSQDIVDLCSQPMLLSLSCFLIVCKFREITCPHLSDLVALSGGRFRTEDICLSEVVILTALDWDLHVITVIDLCNKIMSGAPRETRSRLVKDVHLLAEAASYDHGMQGISTVCIAVCSILVVAEGKRIPPSVAESFMPSLVLSHADLRVCAHLGKFLKRVDPAVPGASHAADYLDKPQSRGAISQEANLHAENGAKHISPRLEIEAIEMHKILSQGIKSHRSETSPSPSNVCSMPTPWTSWKPDDALIAEDDIG